MRVLGLGRLCLFFLFSFGLVVVLAKGFQYTSKEGTTKEGLGKR